MYNIFSVKTLPAWKSEKSFKFFKLATREFDMKRTYLFIHLFIYLLQFTPPHYKYIVHLSIQFLTLTVLDFQILSGPSQFNRLQQYKGSYCYVTVFLAWTVLTLGVTIEFPQLRGYLVLASGLTSSSYSEGRELDFQDRITGRWRIWTV